MCVCGGGEGWGGAGNNKVCVSELWAVGCFMLLQDTRKQHQ